MKKVIDYAKKTFLAFKDPYNSIYKVYPLAINRFEDNPNIKYLGVKNVSSIPLSLIEKLESSNYVLHTIDKSSHNGRAVDYNMTNPISGQKMTGSSSGTAINVFLGINDLGIGNDGGGSVLAPAMAVNCYGFISPLIEADYMKQFEKLSTDNIKFYPSLGFITRDYRTIYDAIIKVLDIPNCDDNIVLSIPNENYVVNNKNINQDLKYKLKYKLKEIELPKMTNDRKPLIDFLREAIKDCDVLISYEAKIDVDGLGDTVLGHFDEEMASQQLKSGKFLIRVANMVKATSLVIPSEEFASGYTLFCESEPKKIAKMLKVAESLISNDDELIERYFRTHDYYFNSELLDYKKLK